MKPILFKNTVVHAFLLGLLIMVFRFAYMVTITGESCNIVDFCFFNLPQNLNFVIPDAVKSAIVENDAVSSSDDCRRELYTSKRWIRVVHFYSSVFQDLISDGYLSPHSKSPCVDSVGIFKKAAKPLIIKGEAYQVPFDDNTFDFVFSSGARLESSTRSSNLAAEMRWTLKPEGFAVVHIKANDTYSFNSFLDFFSSFKLVKMIDIKGFDSSMPHVREIVLRKETGFLKPGHRNCIEKREIVMKNGFLFINGSEKLPNVLQIVNMI